MPISELQLDEGAPIVQTLYRRVRDAINDGTLHPGERLTETRLAEAAGISRTPVREVLHRLESEGLIETEAGGRVKRVVHRPTRDEVADLLAVRETLEAMAGRLAATMRSELDVELLETFVGAYAKATQGGDIEAVVRANFAFHDEVWRVARNQYLTEQLSVIRRKIQRLQGDNPALKDRLEETLEDHRQIVAAIKAGDADEAGERLRLHIRRASAIRLASYSALEAS